MDQFVLMALIASLGTWFITALGAATIAFFKSPNPTVLNIMLGFASGVMIAASFWSLLQPAIERAEAAGGTPAWLVATVGFLFGSLFMWASDKAVSFSRHRISSGSIRSRKKSRTAPDRISVPSDSEAPASGTKLNRIIMLVLSITLHNIPEGLAIGVAFGALKNNGASPESMMAAVSIALGIGLQNFPEGAAVSFPLRREGFSRKKSFLIGQASGLVEPIAAIIGAVLVVYVEALLPYALSFAAGSMILVVVHELIPECQQNRGARPYTATLGIVAGFAVMMLLDVMLG